MNWLFGKSRTNLPEPTALQTQKSKQIEQLKAFNQNVTEIHRDVEYRVNFVVNQCPYSLYITLPPQFPQDKPQVKVSPPLRHPWVNDQMIVTGCAGLNNFMMHSDLGKEVRSVVDEFLKTPPVMLPQNQPPFGGGMGPPAYPLHPAGGIPGQPQPQLPPYTPYNQHSTPNYMPSVPMPTLPPAPGQVPTSTYQPQQMNTGVRMVSNVGPTPTSMSTCMVAPAVILPSSIGATPTFSPPTNSVLHQDINTQLSSIPGGPSSGRSYQTPDLPLSFTQLHGLSTNELKDLAEDEDRLLQLVMELPELSRISTDREDICSRNEDLARENMLKKPMLEEKKRILLEKYDELNDLRRTFDECSEKQDALRSVYDPQTLQDNMKVAAQQADEEAETIAEEFVEGKINVQEFNRTFMQRKTLGYLRKAKEEKLSQYIFQNRPM